MDCVLPPMISRSGDPRYLSSPYIQKNKHGPYYEVIMLSWQTSFLVMYITQRQFYFYLILEVICISISIGLLDFILSLG